MEIDSLILDQGCNYENIKTKFFITNLFISSNEFNE